MQEFCRAKYKCKKESVTSNTFLLTFVYIYIYNNNNNKAANTVKIVLNTHKCRAKS